MKKTNSNIIDSKIGTLFTMTIGEWKKEIKGYKEYGKAYIPLSEIAGLTRTVHNDRVICKVKLKTSMGLGINGITTAFEVPEREWNELFKYLTK